MKDNQLERIKNDYENIEIPEDLKSKVISSMEKAKQENRNMEQSEKVENKEIIFMNKKTKKIIIRVSQVAAAFVVAITIAANSGASIANAMEKIPVLGAITKVVTFRNYEKTTENMDANITVPKIETSTVDGEENADLTQAVDQVNKSVEEYTNELIAKFEADMKQYEETGSEAHESVYSDYKVIKDTDNLFSLRIDATIAMGGAANMSKIYHIDKRTNQVITLKDLFNDGTDYVTELSDIVKEQMRNKMAADDSVSYFLDSDMPEFDFTQIKQDQNFYIDDNGVLTLVFDEYEVAPGYMGTVEIEIPSEKINNIVKEGYLE